MRTLDVSFDMKQANILVKGFERAPEITQTELYKAAMLSTMLLEREIKENTPRGVGAGGGLAGSINSRVTTPGDAIVGVVGSPLNYAEPVELGSKPHFPPVQAIEDWVNMKLGKGGKEGRSMAFAIARKISREGTKGAFMFETGLEDNEEQIQGFFDTAVANISTQIGRA